jgi:hypothetical protein
MSENSYQERRVSGASDDQGGELLDEATSVEEKVFEGFMVIALALTFLVPVVASSFDCVEGPFGLLSSLPMIQAFVEYRFLSEREVCSFEWILITYAAVVILAFAWFGRQIPPFWIERAKYRGFKRPNYWIFSMLFFGIGVSIYIFMFLINLYSPPLNVLSPGFVMKTWFLIKMVFCGASYIIGFGLFHVLWSIFDGSNRHDS